MRSPQNDQAGPPGYTVKQGHHCGHYRCSLLAPCSSKFFLWPALLLRCLWFLFAWAYLNSQLVSNEVRNKTGHMDCFNACLLWQKPWSIKWRGPTLHVTQKGTRGDKLGLIWYMESLQNDQAGPLARTIKQGHCCGHYRCSLLASCCSKFFLWSAFLLRCFWFLFAWAHVNSELVSNDVCNQWNIMDCLNACLLWPKPGSIKCQGPTPYMSHKKAQGGLRLDLRYEESMKWSRWTPCIHHNTGPLLWPLQVFPAGTLLLQVFPLACFASEVSPASGCRSLLLLCKFPIGFKMTPATRQATWVASMHASLVKTRDYKMRRPHPPTWIIWRHRKN